MSNFHLHTLPQSSKELLDSKTEDTREGLLCFENDEKSYGNLRMIGKEGNVIIPKSGVRTDVLFDGSINAIGSHQLSNEVTNYSFLIFEVAWINDSSKIHYIVDPHTINKTNTSHDFTLYWGFNGEKTGIGFNFSKGLNKLDITYCGNGVYGSVNLYKILGVY